MQSKIWIDLPLLHFVCASDCEYNLSNYYIQTSLLTFNVSSVYWTFFQCFSNVFFAYKFLSVHLLLLCFLMSNNLIYKKFSQYYMFLSAIKLDWVYINVVPVRRSETFKGFNVKKNRLIVIKSGNQSLICTLHLDLTNLQKTVIYKSKHIQ